MKEEDLPTCDVCNQPIYNPFYQKTGLGMCGPCTTGEAKTIYEED